MITVERLDKIEQDLKWAHENADRSAQTRLFVHHIPFLLTILRPVAEALDAQIAEEEEYLATIDEQFEDGRAEDETEESTEDAADSESETETIGIASRVKEFFGSSDDDTPELVDADEATDAPEGDEVTPAQLEAEQAAMEAQDEIEASSDSQVEAPIEEADYSELEGPAEPEEITE